MRLKYLDLLRQIALFYMFFQHSALVLLNQNYNTGFLNVLYEVVPLCPALFLFLAGFSITLYFKKNNFQIIDNKYFFKLIYRGILLIICASILFFIEHGVQLPDLIIAPGILNSIGWMIIISSMMLKFPYKKITFSILISILIIVTLLFEINKINVIPFNYGYEPMSPTIIFGFIGVLIGLFLNSTKENQIKTKQIVLILGIIGIIIMTYFTIKYGFLKIFYYEFGRYTILRIFDGGMTPEYLFDITNKNINFYNAQVWNYNFSCFIASLGAVFILFSSGFFLEKIIQKYLPDKIFLPGEFAFINYFFHLGVISILTIKVGFSYMDDLIINVVFSYMDLKIFIIFLLSLFVLSYLISYFALLLKKRKKKV